MKKDCDMDAGDKFTASIHCCLKPVTGEVQSWKRRGRNNDK